MSRQIAKPHRIALALQGGGSFGAFSWGVADRLLAEEAIEIAGISGASAGAVNASLIASGLAAGGRDQARATLARFWQRLAELPSVPHLEVTPAMSGAIASVGAAMRAFSPYQLNPLNLNPLRRLLASEVDFDRIQATSTPRLILSATRVADGSTRLFRNAEVTLDAVLASACLPQIHHTVVIDDEALWDGGYSANPPILPLLLECDVGDCLVVRIAPTAVGDFPKDPAAVERRLSMIAFNAVLDTELRTIDALAPHIGLFAPAQVHRVKSTRRYQVRAESFVPDLAERSAANLDWGFLQSLRAAGFDAADAWIETLD